MTRLVARTPAMSIALALALSLVVAIAPVLAGGTTIIKKPVAGTNKQAYARFYHSQVESQCENQNSKYDVVILAQYNYTAGASRMLLQKFWVTVYNFSGSTWVRSAVAFDSDGHSFGRTDNIYSTVQNGGSHTWTFDIQPDMYMHGDTTIEVKTRHGSATAEWCGELDDLAFDLP